MYVFEMIPACSDTCPDGGAMDAPDCNRCICTGKSYTATVRDEKNLPLEDVRISDERWPNIILTNTDETGQLIMADACNGVVLIFSKAGYVDTTSIVQPSNSLITMQKIGIVQINGKFFFITLVVDYFINN
jgi:hypothetical protein